MDILDNSLLTVILTMAVTFLGLSLVVQVVQELYKYLRSTKARAYLQALQDFLGPLANELMRPGVLPDIRVRGPFQLKRIRPEGKILPLKQEELAKVLERIAPPWIQRGLKQLKLESEFQSKKPGIISSSMEGFLNELGKAEQGTLGYWNAFEMAEFFHEEWKFGWEQESLEDNSLIKRIGILTPPEQFIDAEQILLSFRKKFLPHVEEAKENYSQLDSNFEYTYSRANRRLTFIIAILITFIFNFPINVLYEKAQEVDPASAIKFAETTIEIYNQQKELPDSLVKENLELAKKIMNETLKVQSNDKGIKYFSGWSSFPNIFNGDFTFLLYLLYSLVTAIFITFGAPFWNDIASALLRLQKGSESQKNSLPKEADNG